MPRTNGRAAPPISDTALVDAIKRRIQELSEEMRREATRAAEQVALPYRAAIGELEKVLIAAGKQEREQGEPVPAGVD